jgi:sn-glycerol 3-phosphate transport system ATP-binding protein
MEVYRQPANRFVAAFLGTPTMNFLEGQAKDGAFVSGEAPFTVPKLPEAATSIGIRPHDVLAGVRAEGSEIVEMGEIEVDVIERLGAESFAFGALNGVRVAARIDEEHGIIEHGQRLPVTASRERLLFFDDSGVRLSA